MEVSIDTISQLLGKTPHEIRGTLNPINSIVDLPSDDTKQVNHQGREIFPWITPQIFQEWLKQLGMPTDPPPGVRNKWDEFMDEEPWKLPHIRMRATYKNESLFPIPMCILTFIDFFIARVPILLTASRVQYHGVYELVCIVVSTRRSTKPNVKRMSEADPTATTFDICAGRDNE